MTAALRNKECYDRLFTEACMQPGLSEAQATMLLIVALTASSDPHGVPIIAHRYLTDKIQSNQEEKIAYIEYIRNALAKASVLCSFPRSFNATNALVQSLDPDLRSRLSSKPLMQLENEDQWKAWYARGMDFFNRVYGTKSEAAASAIRAANPDLWVFVEAGYGALVSDTTYMSEVDTELAVIVNLYVMGSESQLADHLKGAQNVGASVQQVDSALRIAKMVIKNAAENRAE